jgi:hypothetical protein
MKGAFGPLHWTPETFWKATITEYVTAIEAFNDMNADPKKTEPPSDKEIAGLLAKYGRLEQSQS